MVISNHFSCKDVVKIIQLIANHFKVDGHQVPGISHGWNLEPEGHLFINGWLSIG